MWMWNAACNNECAHVVNLTEKYGAIELDGMNACITHSTARLGDNNIESKIFRNWITRKIGDRSYDWKILQTLRSIHLIGRYKILWSNQITNFIFIYYCVAVIVVPPTSSDCIKCSSIQYEQVYAVYADDSARCTVLVLVVKQTHELHSRNSPHFPFFELKQVRFDSIASNCCW